MKQQHSKKRIARKKVIMYHFANGSFDMNMETNQDLIGNDNKLMPQTVQWFGRHELGYSVLFDMVRKNADVFRDALIRTQ